MILGKIKEGIGTDSEIVTMEWQRKLNMIVIHFEKVIEAVKN